jgi:hypothetical protein
MSNTLFYNQKYTVLYSSIFVCKQHSPYINKTVHKADAYLREVLTETVEFARIVGSVTLAQKQLVAVTPRAPMPCKLLLFGSSVSVCK